MEIGRNMREGEEEEEDAEVVYCPCCGRSLESYDSHEGGWCPDCEIWFPPDIVEDLISEDDGEDDDEGEYEWR